MLRRFFFGDDDSMDAGAMARRVHSAWLTRMLRRGEAEAMPRIPTRRVSEGGFAGVVATEEGREWADSWWAGVLESADAE